MSCVDRTLKGTALQLQVQLGHVFGGHCPEARMGPLATGGARRRRQSLLRVDHSPPHLCLEVLSVGLTSGSCTGCAKCAETWVGLTLISVFHHLAHLPHRFCQIWEQSWADSGTIEIQVNKTQSQLAWEVGTPCTDSWSLWRAKFGELHPNISFSTAF